MSSMLDDARFYAERGLCVLPIRPGTKKPALDEWKFLESRSPTEKEIERWWKHTRNGIAVVCGRVSGVLAVDCDSPQKAQELYRRLPRTEMMTRSSPGKGHLYYRIAEGIVIPTRIRIAGLPVDLKAEGSYCLAAPSVHPDTGRPYERIGSWDREKVPYFDPRWIDADSGKRAITREKVTNLRSYLARVESIQGQHGSAGLVRACAIARDSGISEAQAVVELLWWNTLSVVQPPWSADEIARAVHNTYQKVNP